MSKPIYLFSTSSHPDAISIKSLDITLFKPEINFQNYDYFIITSKQVSEVLKQYDIEDLKPALCISKATADAYKKIDGNTLSVGNGYGDDLLRYIKEYPKSTKWLYLRGKVVASDFTAKCKKESYNIDEVVVYESFCSKEIKKRNIEADACLIFTSPSSVECYLESNNLTDKHTIVVIGKTTAKALPSSLKYQISEKTTIQSCIDIVK